MMWPTKAEDIYPVEPSAANEDRADDFIVCWVCGGEIPPGHSHPKCSDAVMTAIRFERDACAKTCEEDLMNRPDDHVANYFDGGLRHCAKKIKDRGAVNCTERKTS